MEIKIEFSSISQFLDYGVVGVGVLLSIFMFNLILKAQSKKANNQKLYSLIKFYLLFAIIFFILSATAQAINYFKKPGVTIEIDPSDPNFWREDPKVFKWFNAQYKLAKDEFIKLNAEKIKNGVVYQLLFFRGLDEKSRLDSKKKFKRMRNFLMELNRISTINESNIQVKMVPHGKMPFMSFFVTQKNNNPIVIYYLDELVNDDGAPTIAFQVNHELVVSTFKTEFAEYWTRAKRVELKAILDPKVNVDSFYQDVE